MDNQKPPTAPQPPPRPASTPREVVAYLKGVRDLVNRANASRQVWIRQLGHLLRATDQPESIGEAGAVGHEQGFLFKQLRELLDDLAPPAVCDSCHFALTSWLDKHIAACEVMIEASNTGDLSRLRATQGLLAEARVDLQRFNSDCDALIATLRRRAEAQQARRATRVKPKRLPRWPFGGRAPAEAT